ncbi:MAG: TraC family protein [Litorimonas sp.]
MGLVKTWLGAASDAVQRTFGDVEADFESLIALHRPAQLSAFLPWEAFDPACELYVGAGFYGFVIETIPLNGYPPESLSILTQLFSQSVPDNCHLQIHSVRTPRIDILLDAFREARADRDGFYPELCRRRTEFLADKTRESVSTLAPYLLNQTRVFVSASMKGSDDREVERILDDYRDTLLVGLRNATGLAAAVPPDQFVALMDELMNPTDRVASQTPRYDETLPLNRQMVREDTGYAVYRDGVVTSVVREPCPLLGEESEKSRAWTDAPGLADCRMEIRTFEVKHFPLRMMFGDADHLIGSFDQDELRHAASLVLSFNAFFPPRELAKNVVETKAYRAQSMAETPLGSRNVYSRNKARDYTAAQEAIAAGNRPIKAAMFGAVIAPPDRMPRAEKSTRSVFQTGKYEVRRCDQIHLPTWLACLPMTGASGIGADQMSLGRYRSRISDMVPAAVPLAGEFSGTVDPVLLLAGRRGQPWVWSNFSNEGGGNFNGTITGASGSGKSALMSEIVVQHVATGGHAVVIDDGESMKPLCQLLGGQHYSFSKESGFCLNPFDMIDGGLAAEDDDYLTDALDTTYAIYAQMLLGSDIPDTFHEGLLKGVLLDAWREQGRRAGADAVAAIIRRRKQAAIAEGGNPAKTRLLDEWLEAIATYATGGVNGGLFNGPNTLVMDNELIVFELSGLENQRTLRDIILAALFALIDAKATGDRDRRDLIVLDEAWKFIKSPSLAATLDGWARRLRKYGAGLIVGTQSLNDFADGPAESIFLNSEWTICLKSKYTGDLRINPFRNDYQRRLAASLKVVRGEYSEALIICDAWCAIGRIILDPFSLALYSTDARQVAEIRALQARYGLDLAAALSVVIGEAPHPEMRASDPSSNLEAAE